ncbi:uncharacterized protein [Haliotis asinina]|uniref:uncharacterized protein n=1 Tax=Haliotis asinina TaxID=109174 RepID=UPI0035320BBD
MVSYTSRQDLAAMSVLMLLMMGSVMERAHSYNGCVDISIRDLSNVSSGERSLHRILNTTTVSSLAECAVDCVNMDDCAAFFYHQKLQKCVLNSQQVSQLNLTSETGWVGYNLPGNGTYARAAATSNTTETSATSSMAALTTTTPATTTTTAPSTPSTDPTITHSALTTVTSTTAFTTGTTSTATTSATTSVISETETIVTSTTTSSTTTSATTTTSTSTTSVPTASTLPTTTTSATTSVTSETTVIPTTTPSTISAATTIPSTTSFSTTSTTTSTTTATTTTGVTTAPAPISLWVDSVVDFSSQYRAVRWSAEKIVGPPDVYPAYGDDPDAWASAQWTGIEWIEVQFSQSLYITQVDIYETFHAGGVKEVSARNPSTSSWDVLWQVTSVSVITSSRIFSPPIQQSTYKTDQLRITVDCGPANHWVELDAVNVTGHA